MPFLEFDWQDDETIILVVIDEPGRRTEIPISFEEAEAIRDGLVAMLADRPVLARLDDLIVTHARGWNR